MRKQLLLIGLLIAGTAAAQLKDIKPGMNFFSKEQDIQLGQESKAQVERQMPIVTDSQITAYVNSIGRRLIKSPKAGDYPYTFGVVADKNINAFALPGGPIFINTGTIAAAENEAQLAGVMAHEISHVALRHGTNQASKSQLIQLPAMLAGVAMGGSMLGQLAQLGIGLGANSVLLKYSRGAETQADYDGAIIMADAGYNPVEMARFFEILQAQSGPATSQFFASHPNPGNRVVAVQKELPYLPQKEYTTNTGQLTPIQDRIKKLGPQAAKGGQAQAPLSNKLPAPTEARPATRAKTFQGPDYQMRYPENWEVFGDNQSHSVTIASRNGLVQNQKSGVHIAYGVTINYYTPEGDRLDLQQHTAELIRQLQQQNSGMKISQNSRTVRVSGQDGLLTTLASKSPYPNQQEVDLLLTVPRPSGLFYAVFISPQSEFNEVQEAFQQMIQSIQFNR